MGSGVTFPDLRHGTWRTWIWAWVCLSPGLRGIQRPGGICLSGSGRPSRSCRGARRYSQAANGGQEAKGLIPTRGGLDPLGTGWPLRYRGRDRGSPISCCSGSRSHGRPGGVRFCAGPGCGLAGRAIGAWAQVWGHAGATWGQPGVHGADLLCRRGRRAGSGLT